MRQSTGYRNYHPLPKQSPSIYPFPSGLTECFPFDHHPARWCYLFLVFQVHCTLTFFFTVGTTASEECFLTQLCRHPGCSSDQDAADRSVFLVLCLPWPWTVSPNIIYAALKVVVMAKSIWKLVTDSFLVSKMQPAASAMGPVHNKPRPDVSIVVSRMLSFSPQPYEKLQAFCLPADHWQ